MFESSNTGQHPAHGQAGNQQQAISGAPAKSKQWRAKVSCTYNGVYVPAGTIVKAAEMKNPHFEEVE